MDKEWHRQSEFLDDLAEDVFKAAYELIGARMRPRAGWHNRYRNEAEQHFNRVLGDYAATIAAVNESNEIWQDQVNQARRRIKSLAT